MVYSFLPYMILPLYTVMSKMDTSLVEAAEDLGYNRFHCLRRVILPLSVPGIASGVTMVFVPSVSTFYITQKLGGGQITLIGDVIEGQFQTAYNYNLGAALSLVVVVITLPTAMMTEVCWYDKDFTVIQTVYCACVFVFICTDFGDDCIFL